MKLVLNKKTILNNADSVKILYDEDIRYKIANDLISYDYL